MILTTFEPGSGSGEELYSHKGVQGGYVTLGQLELTVEDQVFQLEPGDSFQFESTRPHRYRNVGEKKPFLSGPSLHLTTEPIHFIGQNCRYVRTLGTLSVNYPIWGGGSFHDKRRTRHPTQA